MRDRLRSSKAELSRLLAVRRRNGGNRIFSQGFDLFRKGKQCCAARSQRDATACSMEERMPKLLFEGLNLLSYRRLRQQQLLGGPAET